ncbi:MAG: hypothetical protein AB8G96_08945 [Phycisphaerales bacterium]
MHVLTKIFIVLVSLLACMLVPLVVAYAHNENSYEARFQNAESKANNAVAELASARASFDAVRDAQNVEISSLESSISSLRSQMSSVEGDLREAEQARVAAESKEDQFQAQLATLSSTMEIGQTLRQTLLTDVRELRDSMLESERERIELDEAYQQVVAEKEVAEKAFRALQEEVAQIRGERAELYNTVEQYAVKYGALGSESVQTGVLPDRELETRVTLVRRNRNEVLAEIDAGSRDGVKVGWNMTIANTNGFVARLRVTEVDINKAVGIVELEGRSGGGRVAVGDKVRTYAR